MNSTEEQVARGVMMLTPTKRIWDSLRRTYGHEKNVSRIVEVYEQIFTLHDQSVQELYATLRSLLDEFEVYQSLVVDIDS